MTDTFILADAADDFGPLEPVRVDRGGEFLFEVAGKLAGCSVALEKLGPDGETFFLVGAPADKAVRSFVGGTAVRIPAGEYRANIGEGEHSLVQGKPTIFAALERIV